MTRHAQVDKLKCRICGCGQSTVTNTIVTDVKYHGRLHTIVKRYRQCRYCKFKFVTVETHIEDVEQPLGLTPATQEEIGHALLSSPAFNTPAESNPYLAAADTSPKETRRPQRPRRKK